MITTFLPSLKENDWKQYKRKCCVFQEHHSLWFWWTGRYMREGSHLCCRIGAPQSHCPSPPENSWSPGECCWGLPGTKRHFQRPLCHLLAHGTSFQAAKNFGFLDVIFWTFVTHYWGHDPTIPEKSKPPKIGLTAFGFNDGIFLCFKKVTHAIWLGK